MSLNPLTDSPGTTPDRVTRSADDAIHATQRVANAALDDLADAAQALRRDAGPRVDRAASEASTLAHHGLDAVRDASHQLRERAHHASDVTVNYIRAEPVKATLMAAATGAALMGLVMLLSRPRVRH